MKRLFGILLVAVLAVSAATAQPASEAKSVGSSEKIELVVFAAASMTETMTTIKSMYEAANPNITVTYNFDSSGTLKTQIENGADCDLFISAAVKQMNALDEKNMVKKETRINLLENKTTLAVPEGNPKNITSFSQLVDLLKSGSIFLAIGNSDVPVGQYTQKIFAYYGIDEKAIASCLTYGSNVKEVTTQVKAASVDCGIIYGTDAFSAGLQVVDTATSEMTGGRVIYPAAIIAGSNNTDATKSFLEYLKGAAAMKVFEAVGFSSAL